MNGFLAAARALHFGSLATVGGLFLFLHFVAEPASRDVGYAPPVLRGYFRAVGWAGLFVLVLSGAAWLSLLAFNLADGSWHVLIEQSVLRNLLLETRFGYSVLVRLALAAALAICLLRLRPNTGWRSRWPLSIAAVLSACLAASLAWSGHGSSGTGTVGEIQLGADAIHAIAAVAWVGGLLFLLVLLAFSRRVNSEPARSMAARAISRFSALGLVSVGALLATGMINTYSLVGSAGGLVGTEYGLLLLAKLALFGAMVLLAAANRFRHLPRLCTPGGPASSARDKIERNAVFELGLGGLIFVIVAVLGIMVPAEHTQAWWPFPLRLSTDALQEPNATRTLALAGAAVGAASAAMLWAVRSKQWRWPALAMALALLVWAVPQFRLLTTEAYPTSFFVSPTGYTVASIASGRMLFAENCATCHGPSGHGDGPVAKDLPVSPADLTAEHIYSHSDGDLFWWVTHGISPAMPEFGSALDETARWNLIDFIHANADARRLEIEDEDTLSLRVPAFSVECPNGTDVPLDELRGQILHLVFAGSDSGQRLEQLRHLTSAVPMTTVVVRDKNTNDVSPFCSTRDPEVALAFAVYRGASEMEGTEFLIDASGWLRAVWYPGIKPDWRESAVFTEELETIIKTSGRPPRTSGHVHAH